MTRRGDRGRKDTITAVCAFFVMLSVEGEGNPMLMKSSLTLSQSCSSIFFFPSAAAPASAAEYADQAIDRQPSKQKKFYLILNLHLSFKFP